MGIGVVAAVERLPPAEALDAVAIEERPAAVVGAL